MKKRNPFLLWLTIFCLLVFAFVSIFIEGGWPKMLCGVLSFIGVIYGVINTYFGQKPAVRRFRTWKEEHPVWGYFSFKGEDVTEAAESSYHNFKIDLLTFMTAQLDARMTELVNPDIFTFDFDLKPDFTPGTRAENKEKEWQFAIDKSISFLIGSSGSGKTFELVRRALVTCRMLQTDIDWRVKLIGRKIPVFIELKSLDLAMDEQWLVDYLVKTAATKNKMFSPAEIRKLIRNQDFIFFFDGLDEVSLEWREGTLKKIMSYALRNGVTVSCRTVDFQTLDDGINIPLELKPAIYHYEPLTEEKIRQLIAIAPGIDDEDRVKILTFLDGHPNVIQHLSRSIILNLFIIVFRHLSEEEKQELIRASDEKFTDLIWQHYEDEIAWKKLPRSADTLGLRTWSVWIAKLMPELSFSVESIQPVWLKKVENDGSLKPHRIQRALYFLTTRIIAAVFVGLAMGFLVATPAAVISPAILGGIMISIIAGIYKMIRTTTKWGEFVTDWLMAIILFASVAAACGFYQGVTVPRSDQESAGGFFSPTEAWPGILLGFALSSIFIYRIIVEKKKDVYIETREEFHFNPGHALIYGLSWGAVSGVISGSIALGIKYQFASGRFIKYWLTPFLRKLVDLRGNNEITEQQLDIAIFLYAFVVTFFVASIIIVLMAARYNEPKMAESEKQSLNYGIITSIKHAFFHGFGVVLLAIPLYYVAMFRVTQLSWYFCIKISIGLGILTFLWYGGMEVVNHLLLRASLYLHGIAPFRYKTWFDKNKQMGLIIATGFQTTFYHPSLGLYYQRMPLRDNGRVRLWPKVRTDIVYFSLALLIFGVVLYLPFYNRYSLKPYHHDFHDGIVVTSKQTTEIRKGVYQVTRTGNYRLTAKGRINVGTFVGYVNPEGTIHGFMGMPIGGAYNLPDLDHFPHGALLIKVQRGTAPASFMALSKIVKPIFLYKGDIIELLINDIEPNNNKGYFYLSIKKIK